MGLYNSPGEKGYGEPFLEITSLLINEGWGEGYGRAAHHEEGRIERKDEENNAGTSAGKEIGWEFCREVVGKDLHR